MEVKDRRSILGGLAAMLATPLLLGREALVRALAPGARKDASVPPKITPPDHSVKRRG
jgi:hypothetical protein